MASEVAADSADVAGVACPDRKKLEAARFVGKILEGLPEGVGRPEYPEALEQIDSWRDFAVEESVAMGGTAAAAVFAAVRKSAGEEASVGTYVAGPVLVAWVQYAVESPQSDTPNDLASYVGPTLSLDALMCPHIWRNTRRPQGSGRRENRARYPPTSRIPLAISRSQLDDLPQSSLRTPRSARIARPISCANSIRAHRQRTSFPGYCVLYPC